MIAGKPNIRIIPRMDIKGPNLVKGVHLEGLRVLGRPELFAPVYYQDGADEIIYIDSVASLYGRNNLREIVSRAAENIFIPLTVGGGIRTIDDIYELLRAGADKVAINTAAIKNPNLINEASKKFGSQCIVVSIQARKTQNASYECLTDNAREKTNVDVFEWVKKIVDLGAGEILLTSVDQEGTGKGYDVSLTSKVCQMVSIPVITCGGAGNKDHVRQVIHEGKADAVSMASILHYGVLDLMTDESLYKNDEGNIEFLKQSRNGLYRNRIESVSIREIKSYLLNNNIQTRNL